MLVNITKLSEITGISAYSLRKLTKSGKIPCVVLGEYASQRPLWRFNPDDVQKALADAAAVKQAEFAAAARSAY